MCSVCHYCEIFNSIIFLIAVQVVYIKLRRKNTTKVFFNNKPMFHY